MTLTSEAFAPEGDAPDSSCPTVRYPGTREPSRYEGLDTEMIERADSVFPAAGEPMPDAWLEPLPIVSFAKWFELLES